jgi:hypothetical protein
MRASPLTLSSSKGERAVAAARHFVYEPLAWLSGCTFCSALMVPTMSGTRTIWKNAFSSISREHWAAIPRLAAPCDWHTRKSFRLATKHSQRNSRSKDGPARRRKLSYGQTGKSYGAWHVVANGVPLTLRQAQGERGQYVTILMITSTKPYAIRDMLPEGRG